MKRWESSILVACTVFGFWDEWLVKRMIIIAYDSAVELWRSFRQIEEVSNCSTAIVSPGKYDAFAPVLCDLLGLSTPYHLLLNRDVVRGDENKIKRHHSVHSYASGSFRRIEQNLYASSPELTLVQTACCKEQIEALLVAYEFCGRYRQDAAEKNGLANAFPLTTKKKIEEYIKLSSGLAGTRKLAKLVPYILEGSASPMESKVALLLCLPACKGGYGFKLPQLNAKTQALSVSRGDGVLRKGIRECDLFWLEERVALEYNSDAYHSEESAQVRDSIKQSELGIEGITVIPLCRKQVYDAREFDLVARRVAKALGVRLRIRAKGWMTKRYELRKELGLVG